MTKATHMPRILTGLTLLCISSLPLSGTALAQDGSSAPWVVGGQVSRECAFPGVVKPASPTSWDWETDPNTSYEKVQLCTGTLVHPRVVVYAAHCLRAGYLRLGENKNGPLFKASEGQIIKANVNPDWRSSSQVAIDWAYLVLKEPVKGVPLIPMAYGSELNSLIRQGAPVVLAGYSDNEKGMPEDQRDFRQKWAQTTIRSADGGVINAGGSGKVACKGDSGGPLLARASDGSWRMIGIASTRAGGNCDSPGAYNRYSRVRKAMVAWLEKDSGFDLTPCWDLDGNPTPSAACDQFMAYAGNPSSPTGSWSNNCKGAKVLPAKDAAGIEDSGETPEPSPGEESPSEESPSEESPSEESPSEESPSEESPSEESPSEESPSEESPSEESPSEESPSEESPSEESPSEESPSEESPSEDSDDSSDESLPIPDCSVHPEQNPSPLMLGLGLLVWWRRRTPRA